MTANGKEKIELDARRLKAFMALEPGIRDLERQCEILLVLIDAKAERKLILQAAYQAADMASRSRKRWYRPEGRS